MYLKAIPERTCIGCNEKKEKKDLIRIVKSQDGVISVDTTGKANGRGAYICKSEQCLEKAIKTKRLERSLKEKIDSKIYESLRLIGLAMRAGKLKFGTDSCIEAIEQNKIKLIFIAKDASERTKLNFKELCTNKKIPIYEEFEEYDLSHAIGKQNKVVIGVCDDNFSKEIIKILNGGEVIG